MDYRTVKEKRRVTAEAHGFGLPQSNECFSYRAAGTGKRDAPDLRDGGVGEKFPDRTPPASRDDDKPAPRTTDPSVERRAKRRRDTAPPPGVGTVLFPGEPGDDGSVSDSTKISDLDELDSFYANEEVPRWEHAFEVFTDCDFSPKDYWTVYKLSLIHI